MKNSDTVVVPAGVLQDLIWNAELMVTGMGNEVVERQCRTLQNCIDGELGPEPEADISLEVGNVVYHSRFSKRK